MKSLSEILLEKLRVTKPVYNYDSSIIEEYDNFIEEKWIDNNDKYSLTYFKEVEIPNIFKLVLKDPDAWYNIIKFYIIFARDISNGNIYHPNIIFSLDNDKSDSSQIKLFINEEKTRLMDLHTIYDIEQFLKDDFYKEIKIDTVDGFISFLKEAIRFHVSPGSRGNTINITW